MRGPAKICSHLHVMKTQTSRIIPLGLLTAAAAYFTAGVAVAQTLTTRDRVAARVGVFLGGSTFTLETFGHTGQPGDRAVEFGMGTGPVTVQDVTFLNALAQNDEITFAFWAKKYDIADASAFWAYSPSSSNGGRGAQVHVPWSDNRIYWDTAGCCDAPQRIDQDVATFPGYVDVSWWSNWHFFVFTKKGVDKEIWIDGQLFLSQQLAHPGVNAAPLPTDFVYLDIGADSRRVAGLFHGLVDDFCIYGTALTQDSITALFGGTLPNALSATDRLTAWWDFNDFPAEGGNAQNLVTNPGFEDGTTGWLASSAPLAVTTSAPLSGSACGVVSTISSYGTIVRQDLLGKLRDRQTYTLSAWMRLSSGTAPITMGLAQTDAAGSRLTSATKTISTSWTLSTLSVSLSVTGALTALSITLQNGGGSMIPTIYLDDVCITNSSPPLALVPTNRSVFLSWPGTATNYALQSTTNLAAPVQWAAVRNAVQSNSAGFSVTLPATNGMQFFRLQKP